MICYEIDVYVIIYLYHCIPIHIMTTKEGTQVNMIAPQKKVGCTSEPWDCEPRSTGWIVADMTHQWVLASWPSSAEGPGWSWLAGPKYGNCLDGSLSNWNSEFEVSIVHNSSVKGAKKLEKMPRTTHAMRISDGFSQLWSLFLARWQQRSGILGVDA